MSRQRAKAVDIVAALQAKPMTSPEVCRLFCYQADNTVTRILKNIDAIATVDWRYNGTALVPVYGISDTNLTREAWHIQHGQPASKAERKNLNTKRDANAKNHDGARPASRVAHNAKFNGIPAKVIESFKSGASVVLFDGVKYTKEMTA